MTFKKVLLLILLMISVGCLPKLNTVQIEVNSVNEIFIQNKKINRKEFKKELKLLTKGISKEEWKDLKFSIKASKETKVNVLVEIRDAITAVEKER